MSAPNVSELYKACYDGETNTVRHLLLKTPLKTLNRLEANGTTCLHVASARGHKEIVRLLLTRGACRRVTNQSGRTPLDEARSREIADLFPRSAEAAMKRFSANPAQQPEWQFEHEHAEAFARATHWGCIRDRGIKKTVKKIHKAHALVDDGDSSTEVVENYFKEAVEKKDPILLLKAYTVEGQFYRRLNRAMATGSRREVYEKLRRKWTGYYTGCIVKNPAFDRIRFSGQTYRGMEITQSDFAQYKPGVALANKSFQSTSKSWKIAKDFACPSEPTRDRIPVIIIFTITDKRSALSIEEISEFQHEEEVLIVPGTLFIVADVNQNERPHEIELRQLEWKNEF